MVWRKTDFCRGSPGNNARHFQVRKGTTYSVDFVMNGWDNVIVLCQSELMLRPSLVTLIEVVSIGHIDHVTVLADLSELDVLLCHI